MNILKTAVPVPSEASSDAELVSLAAAGNDLAFAQIMRRYNRLLFRTARSILKSDDDAQDALQEAYLRAWRALATFRADARLSTWLVRIVVNEALGRLRRKGAQVMPLNPAIDTEGETPEMQTQANPDDQPEPLVMRAQVRQQHRHFARVFPHRVHAQGSGRDECGRSGGDSGHTRGHRQVPVFPRPGHPARRSFARHRHGPQ